MSMDITLKCSVCGNELDFGLSKYMCSIILEVDECSQCRQDRDLEAAGESA